jgi:hypothetical protein
VGEPRQDYTGSTGHQPISHSCLYHISFLSLLL